MVDLHTHILPGLDDGSRDMEDSLDMAQLSAESGVKYLVATPHSNQMGRFENFYSDDLLQLFRRFQSQLRRYRIELNLYLGMEIFASDDMERKIRRGQLISLNGSRYYLVEFSFDEEPVWIQRYLDQIFSAGGVPLIAHPERYYCVQDAPELVYQWLKRGCRTQINRGSLFGRFGPECAEAAETLLQNDLVTCIASDAHRPDVRTTYMADARDYLAEQFGQEMMIRLTRTNPLSILRNESVPLHGRRPPSWGSSF